MKSSSYANDHVEVRPGENRRSTLLATAAAWAVDVSLFHLCLSSGLDLSVAQMVSFAVAVAVIYFLKARPAFAQAVEHQQRQVDWLPWQFSLVGLLILFFRGGVLSLLVRSWGWLPQAAIFPAAAVGVMTMVGAVAFLIRLWEAADEPELRWRMLTIGIVSYLFALRLIYLGQAELLPEEAYYWNYSQHLDIGYLDHPPMVAWLIWLGTTLFGQNEFGVRIGAFGCWMVTSWFVYRMTSNLFDKSSALVAVLLAQVLPFFFSVGFLMTPDAPLVACWSGALYFAVGALIGEHRHAWWGVGICFGLGMISKYSIGVLVPAMLLFLLLDSRSRRWFLRWEPYAAALVAALIFSPVIRLEFPARLGIVWFPRRPTTIGPRTIFAARSDRLGGGVADSDGRSGSFADALSEPSCRTNKRSNGEAALTFYSNLHAGAAGSLCGVQFASPGATQLDGSALAGSAGSHGEVDLVFAERSLATAIAPSGVGPDDFDRRDVLCRRIVLPRPGSAWRWVQQTSSACTCRLAGSCQPGERTPRCAGERSSPRTADRWDAAQFPLKRTRVLRSGPRWGTGNSRSASLRQQQPDV